MCTASAPLLFCLSACAGQALTLHVFPGVAALIRRLVRLIWHFESEGGRPAYDGEAAPGKPKSDIPLFLTGRRAHGWPEISVLLPLFG